MKKWMMLLCFVLMVTPLVAHGQADNLPLPACSNPEIIEVALDVVASDVVDNLAAVAERIPEAQPSDWVEIAADLDGYETLWWKEVVPQLPQCSFALEMGTAVGRYIDEMLLSASMTQLATSFKEQGLSTPAALYTEIADGHMTAIAEYADKVSELVKVIRPFM